MRHENAAQATENSGKSRRFWAKSLSIAAALAVWQAAAFLIAKQAFLLTPLPSPTAVLSRLLMLSTESSFWQAIACSAGRIFAGFFLALLLGGVLAVFSNRFPVLETLLWPYIAVMKGTPVASFIILCLILMASASLPTFASFLMVMPIIYTNVLQGLGSTNSKLLEMADVFRVGWWRRLIYIYLPQLKPYLLSACSIGLGMTWKAGIAAEVIGVSAGSIGEQLYYAKVYLLFQDLFAWTAVIIAVSVIAEKGFLALLRKAYTVLEGN